jgi:hypothetical protein
VNKVIRIREEMRPTMREGSKISAVEIRISVMGMAQTRKGVNLSGKGWLFISPMKWLKSRNLLRLAYMKSIINKAEIDSNTTCLLIITSMV